MLERRRENKQELRTFHAHYQKNTTRNRIQKKKKKKNNNKK
jgi:hypothetical protein